MEYPSRVALLVTRRSADRRVASFESGEGTESCSLTAFLLKPPCLAGHGQITCALGNGRDLSPIWIVVNNGNSNGVLYCKAKSCTKETYV